MKQIGRIGENLRIVCPIIGYPAPMVEWSKNGEKIDFMWERHQTGRKTLRIKNANEDDTGVYSCKGINGFGSEEVRIELILSRLDNNKAHTQRQRKTPSLRTLAFKKDRGNGINHRSSRLYR